MTVAALAKLEANASDIARMLRVFANEHRVRILCHLAASKKELSFAELADGIQISQSALSQHLMKLRKGGQIDARRAGHNFYYRLADPRALHLAIGLQTILKGTEPSADLINCRTNCSASVSKPW
jgi:DNA-binding transcriptional ArsR family regulator